MSRPYVVCCENAEKARQYAAALVALGIAAERLRVLTPQDPGPTPRDLAARAAGVLLCGGPDLDPSHYGEEELDGAGLHVDEPLDRLDREVFDGARAGRTPTWAICRGLQVANVFLGGSLWQDIALQLESRLPHHVGDPLDAPAHTVEVCDHGHPMSEVIGREPATVNSRHHQALKDLAPGLRVLARAEDGVVEVAALDGAGWWLEGVQWHPENLVDLPLQRALWRRFLEAAERHEEGEGQ